MRAPIHPLLAAIFAAHPGCEQELGPWHLGGPQPIAPRRAQAEMALLGASRAPAAGDDNRILAAAQIYLFGGRSDEAEEQLRMLCRRREGSTPALLAGVAVLSTTKGMRNVGRAATAALRTTAFRLGKWPALEMAVEVDEGLQKAEIEGFLRRRKIATKIERVAYRGGDAKGDPVVWLVRTAATESEASAWGTLVRHAGLHWTEGTRDAALAAIPDTHLEAAARAVLGTV
jgi:hypothetical protein